jgi:hypothetical protein
MILPSMMIRPPRLLGRNVEKLTDVEQEVRMWVFEEEVCGG